MSVDLTKTEIATLSAQVMGLLDANGGVIDIPNARRVRECYRAGLSGRSFPANITRVNYERLFNPIWSYLGVELPGGPQGRSKIPQALIDQAYEWFDGDETVSDSAAMEDAEAQELLQRFENDDDEEDADDGVVDLSILRSLLTPGSHRGTSSLSKTGSATKSATKSVLKTPKSVKKDTRRQDETDERLGQLEDAMNRLVNYLETSGEEKKSGGPKKTTKVEKSVKKLKPMSALFDTSAESQFSMGTVSHGGGAKPCDHPPLVRSYESRQRQRARMLQQSYYVDNDDADGSNARK